MNSKEEAFFNDYAMREVWSNILQYAEAIGDQNLADQCETEVANIDWTWDPQRYFAD